MNQINNRDDDNEQLDDKIKDSNKQLKKKAIAVELESLLNRTSTIRHLSILTSHKSKEESALLSDSNNNNESNENSPVCFLTFLSHI